MLGNTMHSHPMMLTVRMVECLDVKAAGRNFLDNISRVREKLPEP